MFLSQKHTCCLPRCRLHSKWGCNYITHKKRINKNSLQADFATKDMKIHFVISANQLSSYFKPNSYHGLFVNSLKKWHLNQLIATLQFFHLITRYKFVENLNNTSISNNNKSHFLVQIKNKFQLTRCVFLYKKNV